MLKKIILLQISVLIVILCGWEQIKGQTTNDQIQPDDEKIFSQDEVDVKAKVTKSAYVDDVSGCKDSGFITLRVVLRKSGNVTDIQVVKLSECKTFNDKVIKAIVKIKFNPAIKDGEKVSQRKSFQYKYHTGLSHKN